MVIGTEYNATNTYAPRSIWSIRKLYKARWKISSLVQSEDTIWRLDRNDREKVSEWYSIFLEITSQCAKLFVQFLQTYRWLSNGNGHEILNITLNKNCVCILRVLNICILQLYNNYNNYSLLVMDHLVYYFSRNLQKGIRCSVHLVWRVHVNRR